jgi:uncharacterized membrane protein
MQTIRAFVLIAATMTMGLIAGAFALYAHTIMPGLASTDDRTFIAAFQAIDRAIINPWFMASAFLGALGWTVLAAVTNRGRPALPWIAAALLLYLIAVVVTIAVNVPLNDAIKAAGDPRQIADPAIIRQNFHQTQWVAWNLLRVATSITASGCLCWALLLHGRSTG